MAIASKYRRGYADMVRDTRPLSVRFFEWLADPLVAASTLLAVALILALETTLQANTNAMSTAAVGDFVLLFMFFYARWVRKKKPELPFKMPAFANMPDPGNPPPGGHGVGKSEGILYLGIDKESGNELWLTNSDARTHILYLGTTGAGKTEGLKSMVSNALTWGSGFVYIDGKADTDLWGALYSLARRFGRDDDLLILNYMTGNSDEGSTSNTLNPFATGSASYLANLMVSLMDDAGDDNAMWKGRAVAMLSSLMPALTWKRDHQGLLLEVGTIRDYLGLEAIIRLARDPALPERITRSLQSYLETLPGYEDSVYDDEGKPVPLPDGQMVDTQVTSQQHGYLSMQFTRSLQSLADEYGYIFHTQLADVDLVDVVLNRRILVVLIPSMEKSADEAANLGKIVASALKGMMGSTLGASVEGDWGSVIDNKQTRAPSPYMTVFDEVGYYTAQGMAVMAAQARSLGFSLIFAAQDLPALEKRVKEEARSITGNCNLKIFGKLEDPTDTKDFFDKTMLDCFSTESSGYNASHTGTTGMFTHSYMDTNSTSIQIRKLATYDTLKEQREGESHMIFGDKVVAANMFFVQPQKINALRVQKFLPVSPDGGSLGLRDRALQEVSRRLNDSNWSAAETSGPVPTSTEVSSMIFAYQAAQKTKLNEMQSGAMSIASIAQLIAEEEEEGAFFPTGQAASPQAEQAKPEQPETPAIAAAPAGQKDIGASALEELLGDTGHPAGDPNFAKQTERVADTNIDSDSDGDFDIDKLLADNSAFDNATNGDAQAGVSDMEEHDEDWLELPSEIDQIMHDAAKTLSDGLNAEQRGKDGE